MDTSSHLKGMQAQLQIESDVSLNSQHVGVNLTPRKVDLELDVPLREHLDEQAIKRGLELYKNTR